MPEPVLLPALGESVTEGTVTRWLKAVGDTIELDEPLVEVSTDKVDTELPSPFAGILESILVREDQTAEIGQVLAHIGGSPVVEPVETRGEPEVETGFRQAQSPAQPHAQSPASCVTPLVRKLARQHGVALSAVAGTGAGGRIQRSDVLAAAPPTLPAPQATAVPAVPAAVQAGTAGPIPAPGPAAAPKPSAPVGPSSLRGTTVKAPRIRQAIAARMRASLAGSTQLTQVHEVDVTALARLREADKADFAARHGVKLTFLPFIAVAVAEALQQHPVLNAGFDEAAGTITYHGAEHLAFAVDTPRGMLVPVVRDAGTLNLAGMARGIADVAARARAGSVDADELSGGTFSITNLGSVGALFDTPIINQPQVGILGVGAIVKRPGVVNDRDGAGVLGIRHMMYLCLTYDHRLVDGADAGRFLQAVTRRLEAAAFER